MSICHSVTDGFWGAITLDNFRSLFILEDRETDRLRRDELRHQHSFLLGRRTVTLRHGQVDAGTGSSPWTGGVLLAQYLAADPALQGALAAQPAWAARPLSGCKAIELGAGLGLVSLSAHLQGATVCATEGTESLLPLIRCNIQDNSSAAAAAQPAVLHLDWCDTAAVKQLLRATGPPDLVLGADLVYGRTGEFVLVHLALVEAMVRLASAAGESAGSAHSFSRGGRGALVLYAHTRRFDGDDRAFWQCFDSFFDRAVVDTGLTAHAQQEGGARTQVWAALLKASFVAKAQQQEQ